MGTEAIPNLYSAGAFVYDLCFLFLFSTFYLLFSFTALLIGASSVTVELSDCLSTTELFRGDLTVLSTYG